MSKKNNLTELSISQLIDLLISNNHIESDDTRGEYYKLCGRVALRPDSNFIQKVKNEINEWKNDGVEIIKNKDYCDNMCYQDSYEFFEELKKGLYERTYSNEYIRLICQISGCNTLTDFCSYKQYEHIVNAAFENGIIDELFPDKYKRQRCNYRTTIENIRKCNSRSELAKTYPGSYTIGKRIKGLFDIFYGKINHRITVERGYWMNYTNRHNAAKECKTIFEYRTKYPTAYILSLYAEELETFNWLERNNKSYNNEQRANLIYCYLDETYNIPTVYIGRTYENVFNERITNHKHDKKDVVYKWFVVKRLINVPGPIVLMKGLNLKESLHWEEEFEKQYRSSGYNILNTARTGINHSSTGGSIYKWTYYNIFREAMIYEYRKDFKNNDGSAYVRTNNNKWLKDLFWFRETSRTNLIKKNTDVNKQECWSDERVNFFCTMFNDIDTLKRYNYICYDFIELTKQIEKFFDASGKVLNKIKEDKNILHTLSLLKDLLISIINEQQTV